MNQIVRVSCDVSESATLEELHPLQGELKSLSTESYDKLKKSILRHGIHSPVFVWDDGKQYKILDGHQRCLTLKSMETEGFHLPKIPIVVVQAPSLKEAKAILLTMVSQYGKVENQGLYEFMHDAEFEVEFLDDLDLPGVDVDKFEQEFFQEKQESNNSNNDLFLKTLNPEQNNLLNEAWSEWCREQVSLIEKLRNSKVFFQSLTPAALKIYFLRALYLDKKIPRSVTTARQYHRMYCSGDGNNGSILDLLIKIGTDSNLSERLRFSLQEKPSFEKIASVCGVPMAGYKAPLDFPVELATSLYNEFSNQGSVLDPCHGWGGRYLGFLLSNATYYCGVDASPLTSDALNLIQLDLRKYHNKKSDFICSAFEKCELEDSRFDLVMTSPPYFDREHYLGGEQAHTEYKSYDEFIAGFYFQLIKKSFDSLKDSGHLILQVGNQKYDLDVKAKEIAKIVGFQFVEIRTTDMRAIKYNESTDSEDEEDGEILVIFQKKD